MAKVTPIDAARPLAELAQLARSCGLDPKKAAEHGLVALAPSEVDALVGKKLSAIGFTYHALDGTPVGVSRVRLVDPPAGTPRYLQPTGSVPRLYLPQGHGYNWDALTTGVLVITEGEKKAHAGCVAGVPTVGIGGVWMGAKRKTGGGKLLLPELRALLEQVQHVVISFDSDKAANEQVLKAEQELLALLRGLNKEARTTSIPPAADGSKQGLDDYLLAEGKGQMRARMKALLEGSKVEADINDEWVAERNEHWCYVENAGGEPYVLIDGATRMKLSAFDRTFVAKRAAFSVLGKLMAASEGELWRTHAKRRSVLREVFHTTSDPAPENCLNRYTAPCKPDGYKAEKLEPYHSFVREIVNEDEQRWLYSWIAFAVQTGTRPEWGVFAWSEAQGAGKTFLGKLLGACFSPYYTHLDTMSLLGPYGMKWFEHQRFLLVDEGSNDERSGRKLEELLKHSLSAGHLTVEEKYQPARVIENRALVYLASNHQMTKHVSRADRRTFLLSIKKTIDKATAARADAFLHERPGDRASPYRPAAVWALWLYFSRYKIRPDFDPVRAPLTEAKQQAIDAGYSAPELLVRELMEHGSWLGTAMPEVIRTQTLALLSLAGQVNVAASRYYGESVVIGRALAQAGCLMRRNESERLWAVRDVEAWKKRPTRAWVEAANSFKSAV